MAVAAAAAAPKIGDRLVGSNNEWMDEWMNGWMDEWMDGWMDEWMDEWIRHHDLRTLPRVLMTISTYTRHPSRVSVFIVYSVVILKIPFVSGFCSEKMSSLGMS
ncbi:MAG: hypothetical protein ACJ72U_15985 [Nitrososphaeraceae archaeon]